MKSWHFGTEGSYISCCKISGIEKDPEWTKTRFWRYYNMFIAQCLCTYLRIYGDAREYAFLYTDLCAEIFELYNLNTYIAWVCIKKMIGYLSSIFFPHTHTHRKTNLTMVQKSSVWLSTKYYGKYRDLNTCGVKLSLSMLSKPGLRYRYHGDNGTLTRTISFHQSH